MAFTYLVTWTIILIGGYVTPLTAMEQSCDLPLSNQCNCTFDAALSAYDISCKSNVTDRLIQSRNTTQPIRINLLDLSSNQISALPLAFFAGISDISILDLSNNLLKEFPAATTGPGLRIAEVQLGHNEITALNVSTSAALSDMRKLDLSHNNITEIVGKLQENITWNVHHLDLSFNRLENTQNDELRYLRDVHSLDLTHNRFQITDFFPTMSTKHLNLSYNSIANLPDGIFKHLTELQELVLSDNNITHVQNGWFIGLGNLQVLKLYNNNISSVDTMVLRYLPNLHTMDLSYNSMPSLGSQEFAGRYSYLKTLDLSHNKLVSIDKYSFSGLEHLTTLILAGNHKLSISYGTKLPQHLVFLDLSDCYVAELFECDFYDLVDLKYLHLQGNNLSCDCHMTWLLKWCKVYMDPELKLHTEENQPWICKTDNSLTTFHTYPQENFVCKDATHQKLYCDPKKTGAKQDYLIGSNDTSFRPEDVDLQMNTSADGEMIISKWSVNNAYPIYGFKFKFSGSEEGVKISPWIHRSQRQYTMNDIVSYTNYNVCVSAYHNKTLVIATACASVYVVSYKVYVGIMAGMVAIIPCFVALFIVIWKDRNAPKYEQLLQQQHDHTEKELGLGRGLTHPVTSQALTTAKSVSHHHHDKTSNIKPTKVRPTETESYINQSFSFIDESDYSDNSKSSHKPHITVEKKTSSDGAGVSGAYNSSDTTSLPPPPLDSNLQCCEDEHIGYSTKL